MIEVTPTRRCVQCRISTVPSNSQGGYSSIDMNSVFYALNYAGSAYSSISQGGYSTADTNLSPDFYAIRPVGSAYASVPESSYSTADPNLLTSFNTINTYESTLPKDPSWTAAAPVHPMQREPAAQHAGSN